MITSKISVELIDHMGSDVNIVNAARVSFDKQVSEMSDRDEKLMQYLADHNHWSPFAHTSITVKCKAPLFLARQLVKHQVGGSWNEVSRRYVDSEPEFYLPSKYHGRPDNKKQGRGTELGSDTSAMVMSAIGTISANALSIYQTLLEDGLAPEEARMVLPLNTMTDWYWTGSVVFFARVFNLRADSHAQLAAQEFAHKLSDEVKDVYPTAWKVLTNVES